MNKLRASDFHFLPPKNKVFSMLLKYLYIIYLFCPLLELRLYHQLFGRLLYCRLLFFSKKNKIKLYRIYLFKLLYSYVCSWSWGSTTSSTFSSLAFAHFKNIKRITLKV